MPHPAFIAIDLGAGSGRVIAGKIEGTLLPLEEIHRFDNAGHESGDGIFWNIEGLFAEILEGLSKAVQRYGESIRSIGIDTWGCDFALVDRDGELTAELHQYRDPRHRGMAELMHSILPHAEVFAHTGIRTNFYNTSLHLLAEARKENQALQQAEQLLFVPDLLTYWLTGVPRVERTIASTSQLLDPRTGEWAWDVIDALGLPRKIFGEIVVPGTIIGSVTQEVGQKIGRTGIPVVASASHDTAAAVAGIPLTDEHNLWLSSGTWSIMGIESREPLTGPDAFAAGVCNELGVDGTVRTLKNTAGLWLIQECRRQWALDGETFDYAQLAAMANEAESFTAFIDPDDPIFASPGGMPDKIAAWCGRTGQTVPKTKGAILRVATESLALSYRAIREALERITGKSFTRLHSGGGGIQNELLNQSTANALGIEVVAGPVEATACGNLITQMVATGHLPDFSSGRDLIRRSFNFESFAPVQSDAWDEAYRRFRCAIKLR
jgi:rhamnulokinase